MDPQTERVESEAPVDEQDANVVHDEPIFAEVSQSAPPLRSSSTTSEEAISLYLSTVSKREDEFEEENLHSDEEEDESSSQSTPPHRAPLQSPSGLTGASLFVSKTRLIFHVSKGAFSFPEINTKVKIVFCPCEPSHFGSTTVKSTCQSKSLMPHLTC
jgi:hypothetical protein